MSKKQAKWKQLSPKTRKTIRDLRKAGKTLADIGRFTGIHWAICKGFLDNDENNNPVCSLEWYGNRWGPWRKKPGKN